MDEVRIYDATTHIGYGFPEESLKQALKWDPHLIVAQGTSTDPGPYYLGSGKSYLTDANVKRDLDLIISGAKHFGIPFICSVGGAGADIHLKRILKLVNEIAKENKLKLRVAVISGEIDKEWLKNMLLMGFKAKRLVKLERFPEYLSPEDVDQSLRIVAQMGPEPIMKALDLDVDGVLTGRALDVGLVAAFPLKHGFNAGLVFHMAKILECGALAADPGSGSDGIFGILKKDCFYVKPPNPKRKCTITSVAAHSFYERDNPGMELLPNGYLDITTATYEQFDEKTVRVTGSRFVASEKYTIKLEGVKHVGCRTICIAGVRDPITISKISLILDEVKKAVKDMLSISGITEKDYTLNFRVYGLNGVMGELEPIKETKAHELCIVLDVVAKTQKLANEVCAIARSTLLHYGYKGRKTTAGNLAFPFSPSDFPVGSVYMFNIWHVLHVPDPCEPFKIKVINFPVKGENIEW